MRYYTAITLENLSQVPAAFKAEHSDKMDDLNNAQADISEARAEIAEDTRGGIIGAEGRGHHYQTIRFAKTEIELVLRELNVAWRASAY